MHTPISFIAAATLSFCLAAPTALAETFEPRVISFTEAVDLFDEDAQFIDVRPEYLANNGSVEGANNLPLDSSFSQAALAHLAKTDQPVVFFCDYQSRKFSVDAAILAANWGYKEVYVISGGYPAWEQANLPFE